VSAPADRFAPWDRLARSYRLLLRAYPRWYRDDRGQEMLTTLLDAAPPDRRRPAGRDAADLVAGGLRRRLRPPRGVGYHLTVVTIALFTALVGLAVAGLLSRPAPPTEAQAVAVGAVAVPAPPSELAGPAVPCTWCPTWDDGPLPREDFAVVGYRPSATEVPDLMAQARDRLAAAGWRVGPVVLDEDSGSSLNLRADKDGTAISLTGLTATPLLDKDVNHPDPGVVPVTLVVTRSLTPAVAAAMAAGVVGGFLAGWLVTAWILQCFRRHRGAVRATMLATGLPVLVLAGAADAYAGQWAVGLTFLGHWTASYLRVPAMGVAAAPGFLAAVAVAALATAVAAALPGSVRGGLGQR
jgi:hypothetical protein